jgi:hypothetical protein
MDDIKNESIDQQDQDNYQEILDKYAASVKPETDIIAPSSSETVTSETVTTVPASTETNPVTNDSLTPPTETEITPTTPINPPQSSESESKTKTPEEIKAEIDRILTDDTHQTPSSDSEIVTPPPVSPPSKFLKTLFIISLIIFLAIVGLIAYFMLFDKPAKKDSVNESLIPTSVPEATCEYNEVEYKLGESFPSADGCNTCVCQSPDVIACTERACDINSIPEIETTTTPASPATKSGTKTIITPTTSVSPTSDH